MEWDNDVFDSDGEHMSLAAMRKLANELSLPISLMDDLSITDEVDPWE